MRRTGLGFCFGVPLLALLLAAVAGAGAAPSRIFDRVGVTTHLQLPLSG